MARVLIERLPDTATFDDLMYALYVRQKIEAGLKDAAEGRVLSHEEVVRELLPTPALNSPDAAATHNDRTRY